MMSVVVLGSLNADLTVQVDELPRPGQTVVGGDLIILPGGKSANQAVAAARSGARVRLVGAVGEDVNGEILLAAVTEAGVDASGVRRVPGVPTGTALIAVDRRAENTIIVSPGANAHCSPGQAETLELGSDDVLCLALEVPIETVVAAAERARALGATVILNASPLGTLPAGLRAAASVLVVNAGEAETLFGIGSNDLQGDARRAGALLACAGIARAVVTLGSAGAIVFDGAVTRIAPTPVRAIDTTGAGDAFTGALAARISAGDGLLDAARTASRYAAATTTSAGAQASYPQLDAIEERLTPPPPIE
jgi:ribokinase